MASYTDPKLSSLLKRNSRLRAEANQACIDLVAALVRLQHTQSRLHGMPAGRRRPIRPIEMRQR